MAAKRKEKTSMSTVVRSSLSKRNDIAYKLTLKTVMNLYTDEISKLAILAKLPVPKKATLNKIT
jgi:hypothetical protein